MRALGERWTVAALLSRFVQAPGHASPATRQRRSSVAAAITSDQLGQVRVGRLGPLRLSESARRWRSAGVPASQVRARVNLLRAAARWAASQDLLAHDVLAGARGMPDGQPRTHAPVSTVREMLSAARDEVVQARERLSTAPRCSSAGAVFRAQQLVLLVQLVAETGLRRGELAGLRSDDLVGRVVWVERAVKPVRGGVVVGPVKTYRAGQVAVSTPTARLWRDYLVEWFGPSVVSGVAPAWLFSVRPGDSRPSHPGTLAARFQNLSQRVTRRGEPVGLHRVRHTVATTLVGAGELEVAQHRLRHSRLDTTLRHYVDTTGLPDDADVADDLENFYRSSAGLPDTVAGFRCLSAGK